MAWRSRVTLKGEERIGQSEVRSCHVWTLSDSLPQPAQGYLKAPTIYAGKTEHNPQYPCSDAILGKPQRKRVPGHLTTVRLGAGKNSLTASQASKERGKERWGEQRGREGGKGEEGGKEASCSLPLGPGSPLNPGDPG